MFNKLVMVFLIVFINAINGCTNKNSHKSQTIFVKRECILLNDNAFVRLRKYERNHSDSKDLDTAVTLLKEAVKCDTTYTIAYLNMANAYDEMGRLDAEMRVFDKILTFNKNRLDILLQKGLLYNKKNQADSARLVFKKADSLSLTELNKYPDSVNFIVNYIMVKNVSGGVKEGKKELLKQIAKHPNLAKELTDKTNL